MDLRWERNFREQMRRRREALGDSQTAFAKRIARAGIPFHQPTVQRVEDGKRPVRLDEAHVIAQALGTTLEAMVASSDDVRVDATIAVDRIQKYAVGLMSALWPFINDWDEEFGLLVETFTEAVRASPDAPSDVACWLGAWVAKSTRARGVQLEFAEVFDGYDTDSDGFRVRADDMYISIADDYLDRPNYWGLVDERKRPAAMAANLRPYELYYDFLNAEGVFAQDAADDAQVAVRVDDEDANMPGLELPPLEEGDDGVDQAAP